MKPETPTDHVVGRFIAVALVAPVLITAAALVVVWSIADRLPDPIAIHWSANGQADGFAGLWTVVVVTILVGAALPIALGAAMLPALRRGERGPSYRFMGAMMAATSALVVVLLVWTTVMQADLTDARDAPDVWAPLLGSFTAAALAGLLAWIVQPRQIAADPTGRAVEPMALRPGERAVWMRETAMPRLWATLIMALTLLTWALALVTWWISSPPAAVGGVLVAAIVMTLAAATCLAFRVRVDRQGLHVTSAFGFPRFTVRPENIERIGTVDVNPIGEFGGYGLRWRPGRFGVVTRAGEAIEVRRESGRSFVVTVDDAATGAAVLSSVVADTAP